MQSTSPAETCAPGVNGCPLHPHACRGHGDARSERSAKPSPVIRCCRPVFAFDVRRHALGGRPVRAPSADYGTSDRSEASISRQLVAESRFQNQATPVGNWMGGRGDIVANVLAQEELLRDDSFPWARLLVAAGSGVVFAIAAAGSVSAHVSIEEEAVEAGSFAVVTFSVPPWLRRLADHTGAYPDGRVNPDRDPDDQRQLDRRQGNRTARHADRWVATASSSPSASARSSTRRSRRWPTATATRSSSASTSPTMLSGRRCTSRRSRRVRWARRRGSRSPPKAPTAASSPLRRRVCSSSPVTTAGPTKRRPRH